jgi:hypothetical protein
LPGPRLIGFNDVGHLDGFVPDSRRPFGSTGNSLNS